MALARLALRNLQQRVSSLSSSSSSCCNNGLVGRNRNNELLRRLMATTTATPASDGGREVAVNVNEKKSRLFPRKKGRRSLGLWRDNDIPPLYEFFPSGLGNALLQATENINRLFENMNISPSRLMGRVKEDEQSYKLRYEVPGLGKDEVKITIDDGVLNIKGEHKEEEEEGSDDEFWSSRSYGYYNTSLVLPDDAKVEDVKAELKDGVLMITIPRTEKPKKDVKEVEIQ